MKAARGLLRWEQRDLAEKSGVSLPTIKRLEMKPGLIDARNSTVVAVVRAFDEAGVEFMFGDGAGVRLKKGAA